MAHQWQQAAGYSSVDLGQTKMLDTAQRFGFKHLLFEDNHPTATGDCYSLKQMLDESGRGYGTLPPRYPIAADPNREMVLAQDNFARTAQVCQWLT